MEKNEEVSANKHDNHLIDEDEDEEEYSLEKIKALGEEKWRAFVRDELDNKNKKGKMVVNSDSMITDLQEFITSDEITGSDIKLVIEKRMYARPTQNWLNMPFKHLETHDFLTPEEKQVLGDGSQIEVSLAGPNLQMYKNPMWLKIGGYWKNKNYVLKNNWSDFVEANKNVMEEGAVIQVWSFRKDEQLCFAVVCVD